LNGPQMAIIRNSSVWVVSLTYNIRRILAQTLQGSRNSHFCHSTYRIHQGTLCVIRSRVGPRRESSIVPFLILYFHSLHSVVDTIHGSPLLHLITTAAYINTVITTALAIAAVFRYQSLAAYISQSKRNVNGNITKHRGRASVDT
jgi:hypothetical protein